MPRRPPVGGSAEDAAGLYSRSYTDEEERVCLCWWGLRGGIPESAERQRPCGDTHEDASLHGVV